MLDGAVAGHPGKATKPGAQPDTIADLVFAAIIIIKAVILIILTSGLATFAAIQEESNICAGKIIP